jgi:dihydroorotase
MELVIAGNVFLDGELKKCAIGIEDGKIVEIKKVLKGERQFDFGDKLILPAGIDIHVHFRDPGMTQKEDFETGSLAAAFGGNASVIDMPNTRPPVVDSESLNDKIQIARKRSFIDFGLNSAVTSGSNLDKLAPNSTGFKLFLGETTGKLTFDDLDELKGKLDSFTTTRTMVLAVHAEDAAELARGMEDIPDEKYRDLKAHSSRRPEAAENIAVGKMIELYGQLQKKNLKLHICHISSPGSLGLLEGTSDISFEVTPHHMLLSTDDHGRLKTLGKVNPPVRSESVRAGLWNAFRTGVIPIVASDHAPHTEDEKAETFRTAPSGLPGVETTIPLLLSKVKHGELSLERLVSAASHQPARLYGLNKGQIKVGKDADLIAVDMRAEMDLKNDMLHSKCGWSPYEKMPAIFPLLTVSRGNIIIKDGNCEGEPGWGQFIL